MNRISFGLRVSGILLLFLFVVTSLFLSPAKAASLPQDSCGKACACEGFTPEQVWEQYNQKELKPDSYYFYDYPSLCAEKYGDWVKPGTDSMEDILRKVGYFLEEMKAACQKCRGGNAPAAQPHRHYASRRVS